MRARQAGAGRSRRTDGSAGRAEPPRTPLFARPVRDAAHLRGIHACGLLDQERITVVEQVMRRLSHVAVPPEHDDEIRAHLRKHLAVIRVRRRSAQFGCAARDHRCIRIVHSHEVRLVDAQEGFQIRGVVERMPVSDTDRGDAYGHGGVLAAWRWMLLPDHCCASSRSISFRSFGSFGVTSLGYASTLSPRRSTRYCGNSSADDCSI